MDRITKAKLQAVREDLQAKAAARVVVPSQRSYEDYRANLHVHSAFSHDSRGKIEEIVAAAKLAGTQIVMFNEHPADHYDFFRDGHRGLVDGVLLIPGAEMKGFLAFPTRSLRGETEIPSQEFANLIQSDAGMIFLSHLEERMDWAIDGLTGVEIYNTHAIFKNQSRLLKTMRNPLWWVQAADLFQRYPQESFSAVHDYPADYLRRWDELCQQAPHTGVSANDAHQNVGIVVRRTGKDKVRIEDALGEKLLEVDLAVYRAIKAIPKEAEEDEEAILMELRLDPYENSLRHVGTHLLMRELTPEAACEALKSGRAFVAFDGFADSKSFDYCLRAGSERSEMGSSLTYREGMQLSAAAPLPVEWRLIRNGEEAWTGNGSSFTFDVKQAGVYRTEAWLDVAGERRPWILSNPIYLR